ncbi:hypothetical protein O181_017141 [Austropuccinia psidii MF-1]|uniref:Uncharacterized protein n=1 Tax=Austropuccinia psidii MF-1 TaxID=1389203 RepID=A0A9Q3C722_9BASI|nr:hypothetical protein [Austropuccinia psidii MF-1]
MVRNDYPAGYEHTKDAFYIHIKFLWGLIEKNTVPSAPNPSQLNEFYQCFSTPDQLESALANNGPALVPVNTVPTLCNACQKHTKVEKLPVRKMCDAKFMDKNWDDATKDYDLNFLVSEEYDSDDKSSEGTESDHGESVEMEMSDDEEEEYGNPKNENDKMEGVKGKGRETYSEYDEDEEGMEIGTSGRGGYYSGLTEEGWTNGSENQCLCSNPIIYVF